MNKNFNPNTLLRICKSESKNNSAATTPCTAGELNELMQRQQVIDICQKLASMPDDPEHKAERALLKGNLPVICFNASSYKDNHRTKENAVASGLCLMDIDHVGDPRAYFEQLGGQLGMKMAGVVMAQISCSGQGLHLVYNVHKGETLKQSQERLARNLGIAKYDAAVAELARCSFVSPWSYVLYIDPEQLVLTEAPSAQASAYSAPSAQPSAQTAVTNVAARQGAVIEDAEIIEEITDDQAPEPAPEPQYSGLPISLLVDHVLSDIMGVDYTPQEGERNNLYTKCASYVRYFCGNRPEVMLQVLPGWGLDLEERRRACQSICGYEYKLMPVRLQSLVRQLKTEQLKTEGLKHLAEMPKDMPTIFRLLYKIAPPEIREQVIQVAFVMLGTLTTALHYKKDDFHTMRTTMMTYVVGEMASGKSFCDVLEQTLMRPLLEEDARAEAVMQQWRDEKEACGNGRGPKRPHVMIRQLYSDFTDAAINLAFKEAKGAHLYCKMSESDSFVMSRKTSAKLRDSYDGARTGQSRVSASAVSGGANGYLNLVASGTPSAMRNMFKTPEDGLVSRVRFVKMPKQDALKPLKWGKLTPHESQQLDDIVRSLYNIGIVMPAEATPVDQDGQEHPEQADHTFMQPTWNPVYINLPKTEKRIEEWLAMRAAEINTSPEKSALLAFCKRIPDFIRANAMVVFACEGMKETQRGIDLAVWAAERALQQHLDLFGHSYDDIVTEQRRMASPYKRNTLSGDILDTLDDEFDVETFIAKRAELGLSTSTQSAHTALSRYVAKGLLVVKGCDANRHKIYQKVAV